MRWYPWEEELNTVGFSSRISGAISLSFFYFFSFRSFCPLKKEIRKNNEEEFRRGEEKEIEGKRGDLYIWILFTKIGAL